MHRIGFLYNHDVPHQIRHTAPIAAALAGRSEITILTSSAEQESEARRILPDHHGMKYERLVMSPLMRLLRPLGDRFAPFGRLAMLRDNLRLLTGFDALVVPETTTTLLKSRFGAKKLKLIYVPHGISAGAPGYSSPTRLFDLVLLPGPLVRDGLLKSGVITAENSRDHWISKVRLPSTSMRARHSSRTKSRLSSTTRISIRISPPGTRWAKA